VNKKVQPRQHPNNYRYQYRQQQQQPQQQQLDVPRPVPPPFHQPSSVTSITEVPALHPVEDAPAPKPAVITDPVAVEVPALAAVWTADQSYHEQDTDIDIEVPMSTPEPEYTEQPSWEQDPDLSPRQMRELAEQCGVSLYEFSPLCTFTYKYETPKNLRLSVREGDPEEEEMDELLDGIFEELGLAEDDEDDDGDFYREGESCGDDEA
jgi:hypothetical protein